MRRLAPRTLTLIALAAVLVLAGCGRPAVRFIPEGGQYSLPDARAKARTLSSPYSHTATDDAADARKTALVGLRREGTVGAEAADILTARFPSDASGVPYYVEAATINGRAAWFVVEATPGSDGKLSARRLWVLDRKTGTVRTSSAIR